MYHTPTEQHLSLAVVHLNGSLFFLDPSRHDKTAFLLPLTMMLSYTKVLLALSFLLCAAVAAETTLNDETWHEAVAGKSVFIFFDEPENEECRALDDAWARLSADWEKHEIGLVARVDCGELDSDALCEEYGVVTLPVLLYGDPDSPEFYEGDDLSYEALSAFAQEHISRLPCTIKNLDKCSETERKTLTDFLAKPRQELEEMEAEIDLRVLDVEKEFDSKIADIQAEYSKVISKFNADLDEIRKETNYKWLQQVLHHLDLKEEENAGAEL